MVRRLFMVVLLVVISSCTMPFRPAVIAQGSDAFPGIAGYLSKEHAVEVVLVHGMCTHTPADAYDAMDAIVQALDSNIKVERPVEAQVAPSPLPRIQIVERTNRVKGFDVHFSAIIWSPLTAPLKQQLAFDKTGTPNDCAIVPSDTCKPKRATVNGVFKEGLLDDCFSDALIYQGASRPTIRRAMVDALSAIDAKQPDPESPLVVVSASLGSKITFDALSEMLAGPNVGVTGSVGKRLATRLGLVYMEANQLPLLALADQDLANTLFSPANAGLVRSNADPLQTYLKLRAPELEELKLVAFSDPNDLLSYRLLASRYAGISNVKLADVLVSNDKTYLGLVENPAAAHTTYPTNPNVARFVACGNPAHALCK